MANTSSAKKRVRRDSRKTETNVSRRSRVRTYIKKVEAAIDGGDKDAANAALKEAQPELMRGVTRGSAKKYCSAKNLAVVEAHKSHLIWRYITISLRLNRFQDTRRYYD